MYSNVLSIGLTYYIIYYLVYKNKKTFFIYK